MIDSALSMQIVALICAKACADTKVDNGKQKLDQSAVSSQKIRFYEQVITHKTHDKRTRVFDFTNKK